MSAIAFGTAVLTYNQWTGHENFDVSKHFRKATPKEVRSFKPGDTFWKIVDPLRPNGRVCGRVKMEVISTQGDWIFYQGGDYSGVMCDDPPFGPLIVDDESVLAALIAANPQATKVIGE